VDIFIYLVLPRSRTNRKEVKKETTFCFYLDLPRSRTNRKEVKKEAQPFVTSFLPIPELTEKSSAAPLHVGMPWVWEELNWGVLGRQVLRFTETPGVGEFRNAVRAGEASEYRKLRGRWGV